MCCMIRRVRMLQVVVAMMEVPRSICRTFETYRLLLDSCCSAPLPGFQIVLELVFLKDRSS